ncbi:MAG: tagaturonate reductase [Ruminococcaceae bacterium]|jgi:tagaturonate reductase|nr:tagaturonate reductase [Oscillospiraceae bacterium]
MERLTYDTLARQGYAGYLLKDAPERVLQFGEGNFLRAFVEDFIDRMNETAGFDAKVVLVQPRGGHPESTDLYARQEGLYTLTLRGRENGEAVERTRVISCVSRCLDPKRDWAALLDCAKNPDLRFIVSNTTEAGIVFDPACKQDDAPPASFPAKLTAFLHERWRLGGRGFVILSCELIDHNGDELRRCVNEYVRLWQLESEFAEWVERENLFCSTLVDRIVTGVPKGDVPQLCEKLGYEDSLPDAGEVFAAWVIEAPQTLKDELPFEKAGLPIRVVDDVTPYKQRKVRILNGAHTSMVLAAFLAGKDIVRECMEDEAIRGFLNKALFDEIIPTLDLPRDELTAFAASVIDRFNNPYIDHRLLSIALNSTAKWKARVMPSVTEYVKRTGSLPRCLTFSFAAYIAFYCGGCGQREGYSVEDDEWVLDFYRDHADESTEDIARAVVNNEKMWDGALAQLSGFETAVAAALARIKTAGMYEALRECQQ